MFYPLKGYDIKGKKYLESEKKYCLVDTSFRYATLGTIDTDYGHLYENNALVHRTWDIKANTKIEMHPDRIIISSPGGLVADMSKEDYINGNYSYLRNPIIANVFRRLNIIEAFATGIKRINEAYKDAIVKPIYDVTSSAISVTLPIIDQVSLSFNEKKVYDAIKITHIID